MFTRVRLIKGKLLFTCVRRARQRSVGLPLPAAVGPLAALALFAGACFLICISMRCGWEGEPEGAGLAPPRQPQPWWLKAPRVSHRWRLLLCLRTLAFSCISMRWCLEGEPERARLVPSRQPQACAWTGRGSARRRAWRPLAMQRARLGTQNSSKPTLSVGFGAPSKLKGPPRTAAGAHASRRHALGLGGGARGGGPGAPSPCKWHAW